MTARRAQYLELADQLADRWGSLPPGTQVESEHQLAAEFAVNRLTAREAVRELERRQRVRRVAGSGTFTAHRLEYRVEVGDAPSFRRVVAELGYEPGVLDLGSRWSGRGQTREFVISRILTVDGLIASTSLDRFPREVGIAVERLGVAGGSIVEALRRVGCAPVRSSVRVLMDLPDERVAGQLGFQASPPPVWRLESVTTDGARGPVIHRSTSWMRPDMFALTIELGASALQ
jgi:DNA-binding GntR family transcriptional regulator